MEKDYVVTVGVCPSCLDQLALVEFSNGRSFVKCKAGCALKEITREARKIIPPTIKPARPFWLSDQLVMDVCKAARDMKKRIPADYLHLERQAWMRGCRA